MATKQVQAKSSNVVHIYSTLANPQCFVTYRKGGGDLPVVEREVFVAGRAGIANKNLITPMGTHTAISTDDYEAVKNLPHFVDLVERGHLKVEAKKALDIEVVVGDMNPRDPGGPITPADFARGAQDGSVPLPVEMEKAGSGWVLK
jgi:hypothetical protein